MARVARMPVGLQVPSGKGMGRRGGLVEGGAGLTTVVEEINGSNHVAGTLFSSRQSNLSFLHPSPPHSKMSVSLNPPNTLGFRRPLTVTVKRSLFITNHNSLPVAFKVKTTAPKLYCVRPNSGRVEPGEAVEVAVMLQALREEPPLNAKCKDKFLIQSTLITPEKETLPLSEIWVAQDTNDDKQVYQQKLRVAYLPAEGQTLEEEDEGAANQSSMYVGNDNSQFGTVSQKPHDNGPISIPIPQEDTYRTTTPPVDFSVAREESHDSHPPPPREPEVPHQPSPPPPAPEPVAEPTPAPVPLPAQAPIAPPVIIHAIPPTPASVPVHETTEFQELMAQYRQAQLEIERLRTALSTVGGNSTAPPPTELRRRTRVLSDAGSTTETDIQTVIDDVPRRQDGVPLEVVAFVALGVFLTTYLFL